MLLKGVQGAAKRGVGAAKRGGDKRVQGAAKRGAGCF